jgi:ABC-type microcin C transport system permease subunit YejB
MGLHVVANNGFCLIPSVWSITLEAFIILFSWPGKIIQLISDLFNGSKAENNNGANGTGANTGSSAQGPLPEEYPESTRSLDSDESQQTVTQESFERFRDAYRKFITRGGN